MAPAMRFAAIGDQTTTDMTAVQSARDFGELMTLPAATVLVAAFSYVPTFGTAVGSAGLVFFLMAPIARRWIKPDSMIAI
jgi:hypothetical protein